MSTRLLLSEHSATAKLLRDGEKPQWCGWCGITIRKVRGIDPPTCCSVECAAEYAKDVGHGSVWRQYIPHHACCSACRRLRDDARYRWCRQCRDEARAYRARKASVAKGGQDGKAHP